MMTRGMCVFWCRVVLSASCASNASELCHLRAETQSSLSLRDLLFDWLTKQKELRCHWLPTATLNQTNQRKRNAWASHETLGRLKKRLGVSRNAWASQETLGRLTKRLGEHKKRLGVS